MCNQVTELLFPVHAERFGFLWSFLRRASSSDSGVCCHDISSSNGCRQESDQTEGANRRLLNEKDDRDDKISGARPRGPGCFALMPTGCPSLCNADSACGITAGVWAADDESTAHTDTAACQTNRKQALDALCGVSDVETIWNPVAGHAVRNCAESVDLWRTSTAAGTMGNLTELREPQIAPEGGWNHYAIMSDGQTVWHHVNGEHTATQPLLQYPYPASALRAVLGARLYEDDSQSQWFSGSIDNLQMYSEVLPASMIEAKALTAVVVPSSIHVRRGEAMTIDTATGICKVSSLRPVGEL